MSRPTKTGLEYFPHDVDSSSDPKLEALQLIYGFEGYAFFFKMLECIYATEKCEIDISDAETREEILQILAKKTAENRQKFDRMLELSLRHGAFNKELFAKGLIVSDGAKKRAKIVLEKRVAGRNKYSSTHNKDKDKDKGKELEGFPYRVSDAETIPEINNPTFYEENKFGKLDANAADKIIDAEKEYSVLYVSQALWLAVKGKKTNWAEVVRILENSRKLGLSPLDVEIKKGKCTPKELDEQIRVAIDGCEQIQGFAFMFKNEGEKDYLLVKKALEMGYTASDIIGCRQAMGEDDFWASLSQITMKSIVDNLGRFKNSNGNKKSEKIKEKSIHQKLVEKGMYVK
jgi:hypothetical protein